MDIIIITAPTPLNKNKSPNIKEVEDVIDKIKKFLKFGQLITIESTIYPGATKYCIKKINNNLMREKFFFVLFTRKNKPWRSIASNITIQDVPKVVSGYSKNCLKLTKNIYENFLKELSLVTV